MRELFEKRRDLFLIQMSKYTRYVFNDHFVLVLLFLAGFLMVQYRNLLENFPENGWLVALVVVLVWLLVLSLGRVATYLESADQHFLLAKEADVIQQVKAAGKRSFMLWGSLLVLFVLLISPILLKLHWVLWQIAGLVILSLLAKWFLVRHQVSALMTESSSLDWSRAIAAERKRKQSILRFFALFTNVKGISSQTHRRAFLDPVLRLVPKKHQQTWSYLYLRAFLRSGDYLTLSLRLVFLSLLCLFFVENRLLAAGLVLLFDYLLLFQLMALHQHYDYHYLTGLLPLDRTLKRKNLLRFLQGLGVFLTLFEAVFVFSLPAIAELLVGMLVICGLYLPFKLSKMIDEAL